MIKIENVEVFGWEAAIRGMRNPMNSWEKSDSSFVKNGEYHDICGNSGPTNVKVSDSESYILFGDNDYELMMKLAKAGPVHGKFRRMITVYMDILAPLYWWKEFDTYKVGTATNSCSTMHKIHAKEFTIDDFSHEHLTEANLNSLKRTVKYLNSCHEEYSTDGISEKHINDHIDDWWKKEEWWQMIQLLPSSYNQRRTVMMNYEVLSNIYKYRKDHKLDEWQYFCKVIENLPLSSIITITCDSDS